MRHYTAVIYATGAQTDKSLGIPGEDLPGSWAATEFVAWYNGHPDYRDLEFDLSAERAVVIGNGNVAADVTRMLTLEPGRAGAHRRRRPRARGAARAAAIEEVVVLGRRGPAQAAFTSAELRELGRMRRRRTCASTRAEVELDPVSQQWLAEEGTFTARKNVELLREFAATAAASAPRDGSCCASSARRSRSAATGASRRSTCAATRSSARRRRDAARREPVDGPLETIECGLVLRSVGYRAVPLPDVPFDERHFVLPNERGRVLSPDGEPVPGVYAVGWIKRGPTGILGTNKRDAEETVALPGGGPAPRVRCRAGAARPRGDRRAAGRPRAEAWSRPTAGSAIDAHELERGRASERPRVKLASRATSCSRRRQDASRSATAPARSRVMPTAARWPVASACTTAGAAATRSPAA